MVRKSLVPSGRQWWGIRGRKSVRTSWSAWKAVLTTASEC
jgi:hypothetical protein